jgi:hypothetical protein
MKRFVYGAAVLALFFSCELFKSSPTVGNENGGPRDSISLGSITYIITDNVYELLDRIREAQESSNGEHYGDYGIVAEWDVDFEYLFKSGDNYEPLITQTEEAQKYINELFAGNEAYAWYLIELWGADGGDVDTLNGINTDDPANISAQQVKAYWGADHFAAGEETLQRDYAFGGKGGYVAAYIKVYRGQVLYFVLGGRGKDGDAIIGSKGKAVIYGFNGGGMGSGGHENTYLNGGGGGGATSMAVNVPRFYKVSDDDYRIDFTQGFTPGGSVPEAGAHYTSRLLVAGGGGGGGQGHNTRWISLHGGNGAGSETDNGIGNGRMGEEEPGVNTPAGWKTGYGGNPSQKVGVVSRMSAGMVGNSGLTELFGAYMPFKAISGSLPMQGYRTTVPGSNTYGLVIPPVGFGKGMDAGDATEASSYHEGRGGGGGGWTGGGAVFNWVQRDNPTVPGTLNTKEFPTSAGTGGTNGVATAVQVPYFNDLTSIERDEDTLRILSTPNGQKPVEIKLIKSTRTGQDGLQGVKTVADLNELFTDFKGSGFINVRVVPLEEGNNYQTGDPEHLEF